MSLLRRMDERAGGVAAVTIAMGTMWATLSVASAIAPTAEPSAPEEAPEDEPIEVVEARLVQLGSERPRNRLPDRYVPSLASSPVESSQGTPSEAPSTAGRNTPRPQAPPPTDAQRPLRASEGTEDPSASPLDASDDDLVNLGDRAAAAAALLRPREREGDAEGVSEGTATRAEGSIYAGRLYSYFRRGWHVPTSLSDEEVRSLRCVVAVQITPDARVGSFNITRGSGNAAFDQSVRMRMNQARGASLPPPPADEADRFLGRTTTLRFLGRSARR